MDNFKNYMKRFQNVGTILAIVGAIGLILQQFGYKVDMEWLNNTATAVCSLLVLLGIANNPENSGIDLPMVKKPKTMRRNQNGNRFKSRTL